MILRVKRLIRRIDLRQTVFWLVRALVVLVVFQAGRHPSPYVIVGPIQQVQTEHPITCVHTRLTDEVEEWKIQRTLQLVREMGATTIVEFFPWAYAEPAEGRYDWGHSDLIMRHAQAQGLTVIARLGLVPEWAQPQDDALEDTLTMNYLQDERFDEFADFVEAFAHHYRGQINHIIIWNEPNIAFEWGYQQ